MKILVYQQLPKKNAFLKHFTQREYICPCKVLSHTYTQARTHFAGNYDASLNQRSFTYSYLLINSGFAFILILIKPTIHITELNTKGNL